MSLCRNGHDVDIVGRDASGQCRGCRSEQNRRRTEARRRVRGGMCRNGLHPRPDGGPCGECRTAKRRRYRERVKQEEIRVLEMARAIRREGR